MFTLLLLLAAGFVIEIVDDDGVGAEAGILPALAPGPDGTGTGTGTGPDEEFTAAAAVDDVAPQAAVGTEEDTAVAMLCESSLCHLALLCKAALICVHSSFLHDFDLNRLEINFK